MSAPAPTVAPMSRYRAAVPHVCSRPPASRRLLVERALTLTAGVLLIVAGAGVLLATALATVVAP